MESGDESEEICASITLQESEMRAKLESLLEKQTETGHRIDHVSKLEQRREKLHPQGPSQK